MGQGEGHEAVTDEQAGRIATALEQLATDVKGIRESIESLDPYELGRLLKLLLAEHLWKKG